MPRPHDDLQLPHYRSTGPTLNHNTGSERTGGAAAPLGRAVVVVRQGRPIPDFRDVTPPHCGSRRTGHSYIMQ